MVVAYMQRQQILEPLNDLPESERQNILSQYCSADSWIIRRVGIANARRRLQFVYWKQHARRLGDPAAEPPGNLTARKKQQKGIALATGSVQNEKQSFNQPLRPPQQQSLATSATQIPPGLLNPQDTTSVISLQSRASTVFSPKGEKVIWPSPPHVTGGSKFFSCPYCLLLCPDSYLGSDSWRNHLIHDLQPYHCTYESCKDPNRLYSSRQEWIDHESQHNRAWHCQQHGEEFKTQQEYVEHLQKHHEDTKTEHFSTELLSSVVGPSTRPQRECPFCPTGIDSSIEMQRHLAFHLERLAVLALPRDESEMSTDRGSNRSSESHEALQRGRKRSVCEDFEDGERFTIGDDEDPSLQITISPNLTEDSLKGIVATSVSAQISFISLWLDGIGASSNFRDDGSEGRTSLGQNLEVMSTDSSKDGSKLQHRIDTNIHASYAELPASTLGTEDVVSRKHSESIHVTLERLHLGPQFIPFLEQVKEASQASLTFPIRSPTYQPPEQPSNLAPGGCEFSELPLAQGYVEYLGPWNETSASGPRPL
ncbi:hypothetical protein F5Y14DRAFT_405321 [Nemania sp. NC0429]|nr:hypothetical protein F5Y14DRAFT_405321 [Nemania sp. NC0429]